MVEFKASDRGAGIVVVLVLAGLAGTAVGQTNVDLSNWNQKGPPADGDWDVAGDGSFVEQKINGQPTFFVSPGNFANTTVNGRFGVQTSGDDDYMGFVFGYQTPQGTGTDFDFLIFSWAQSGDSNSGSRPGGFALAYANGNDNFGFVNDNPGAGYHVLDTDTAGPGQTSKSWEDNTLYDFALLYQDNRIKIDVEGGSNFAGGQTIFDLTPATLMPGESAGGTTVGDVVGSPFPSGQFGFFNHSQGEVRYESFTQTADPVLHTFPDDGGTETVYSRVGDTRDALIAVTNDTDPGGADLTIQAGSPSGAPFSGPAPGSNFTIAEGDSVSVAYAYAPTARTLGTPDTDTVTIASNEDGTHTIDLEGIAVGPEMQLAADSTAVPEGGQIDFGTIDKQQTETISLDLSNISTDTAPIPLYTRMTVHELVLSGADADKFTIPSFSIGIDAGQAYTQSLVFDPAGEVGTFDDVTLTVLTDQGAPLGGNGEDFTFSLQGVAVPQPASLALVGMGGLALLRRRTSLR